MAQSSFAERLVRIEKNQHLSVEDRMLIGLSQQKNGRRTKSGFGKAKSGLEKLARIMAGFVLLFATITVLRRMSAIRDWLSGMEIPAPVEAHMTTGIAVFAGIVMLFFAFKLNRASRRVISEPARLPFAIGMLCGLAAGLGPTETISLVLAQVGLMIS